VTSASAALADTVGEDLVLLSVRPGSGRIAERYRISLALMGSELARLAGMGGSASPRIALSSRTAGPDSEA
jgi:hypothetical protein